MRVDVIKYLVMGPSSRRDAFFQKIQELGIVEFISHAPPSLETPAEIQTFIDALHVLRHMVPVKQAPTDDYGSANVLAHHVVERSRELERLQEQVRLLEKEISRIQVFGDFSVPNLREIEKEAHRTIQFFFCKASVDVEAIHRPEVIFVGTSYGLNYYIAINPERTSYEGLIEIVIERSLGELQQELASVHRTIDEYETELATLAHHKKLLKQGMINTLNRYHLDQSKERIASLLEGGVFAVEGWVPKNKVSLFYKLADELDIHIEPLQIEKKDRVPTYLENKGVSRLGEDLINIYDTPARDDRDPSTWVFFAFATFFAMIIADTGYGLLLLGFSLFMLKKFGKKGGAVKRVLMLSTYLAIGCVFWGIMLTSFFGIEFSPTSPLRKVSVIHWAVIQKAEYFLEKKPESYTDLIKDYPQLKDATTPTELLTTVKREQQGMGEYVVYNDFTDNVLIELAIFIGTLHIIISFLRYLDRSWSGAGWIIFMVGSYLWFPLILGAVSLIHYIFHVPYELGGMIGKYLVYSGLGVVFILGVIQKRLAGLGEVMHVINVFADVMSYLRIYALSLAGMIMATTFDEIGARLPIYIGPFIIVAGHAINIILALMGGVIHGLRLNFIEWYHYSFEGGGRHFDPLKLIRID